MATRTHLQRDEVLLGSVSRAVDVRHPVSSVASTIHEMTQLPTFENLKIEQNGVLPGDVTFDDRHCANLPHETIVVVRLDFARVDHFSSERTEARPFRDE